MARNIKLMGLLLLVCGFLQACESGECREPRDFNERSKKFDERIHGWLDAADAYEMQRENVFKERESLKPERKKLVKFREATSSKIIDELILPDPKVPVVFAHIDDLQRVNMVYAWKLMDVTMNIHRMFTTEQRQKIKDAMHEPFEPFETPFLARRAIDYVLLKIDADAPQKKKVWQMVETTESRANIMLKAQHSNTGAILTEWVKHKPEVSEIKGRVNKASDSIVDFAKVTTKDAISLSKEFKPEQRAFINDRMRRMKVCPTK